ncbi:MAG: aminomethyl-transferring glycine dehydrogenase subunit GcvPB [Chloroflexota bacterium]|nr:aminomethyl-transferring glycine dehydrogenase subunit GcvPB [Chloroflexota bacterium]
MTEAKPLEDVTYSVIGARLTFDMSRPGRTACALPSCDVPEAELPPPELLRQDLNLPELGQVDLVRYFLALSRLNYGVDSGFYPLGSCTMKYNPKVHEELARLPGFAHIHPLQPAQTVQGALALMYDLQRCLTEITGLDAVSLAPAAGAQGELTGMLVVKAYLADRGEEGRTRVLVPDSAHGTNPATATMAGFEVVTVASNAQGNTDLDALASVLDDGVAALMLTLPNTLGLFEPSIGRIAEMLHRQGALLYGDGANLNALLGRARFGDMGFDVVHLNMHKTFSTPHGGGGPGSGPVAVKGYLAPYLPAPVVEKGGDGFVLATPERSIGRVGSFHGHFGVLLRAYAYIRTLGTAGLGQVSENAVINANYVLACLRQAYYLPYDRRCMHEVVFSGSRQRAKGVRTWDIAKRLIDYGFHPPTVYFPLIVDEALMIEPTETESKEALDAFCDALLAIAREAEEEPQVVKEAPHTTPVGRLDEATAARRPVLRWRAPESEGRETGA